MADISIHYGLAGVKADDSAISCVVPETNSLTYRGYAVQDLAIRRSFEDTAYLIWNGELPDPTQKKAFGVKLAASYALSDDLIGLLGNLNRSAHPMDRLRTAISFLGQEDPTADDANPEALYDKSVALLARCASIVAADHRIQIGLDPVPAERSLGFAANFFHMCFDEKPSDVLVKGFDASLTLYAEHSFNASTFTARTITSSMSDLYSAITGAIGSLKGPLHGGANEAVMYMLKEIETPDRAERWLDDALTGKKKIMGFGHRVYRSGDSRVPCMTDVYRHTVEAVATEEARGLWQISEKLAAAMIERKGIHPNLDYPAGPTYYLMGFPIAVFTPIFAMSRVTGWTAHIMEQAANNRLIRPLANYTGVSQRPLPE